MQMKSVINSEGRLVTVEIMEDSGRIQKKCITFESFLEILNESIVEDDNSIHIGKLPQGFYDACISKKYDNTFTCTIVVPSGVYPVQYEKDVYMLPFPAAVFFFNVLKGSITKSTCYMLKDEVPTNASQLYHYCYSNVYNDGGICWGSNKLPEVKTLYELEAVVNLFYSAPSNNDLFAPDKMLQNCNQYSGNIRGLYMALNGKKEFPMECLKEIPLTLGQLMN